MLRFVGGVIAGLVTWIVVVSALDFVLRFSWHDYGVVERAMTFTLPMMAARLSESAVSSLVSGFVAATVERGRWAALIAGSILLLLFLPEHYTIWSKFPPWYHLTFLISLPLLSWIGGRFVGSRVATA